MAADDKVVIGLVHAEDDVESVLISYLLGVEALRAGKEALMWLTKDGIKVAADGFAATVNVSERPVDRRSAHRVRREGRTVLRLPGVCEDPRDGGHGVGQGCRGQGRAVPLRVHGRRRSHVQLLSARWEGSERGSFHGRR